jgi:hypothetical protein
VRGASRAAESARKESTADIIDSLLSARGYRRLPLLVTDCY